MSAAKLKLPDAHAMAVAKARLKAWWNGEAFDPASVPTEETPPEAPPEAPTPADAPASAEATLFTPDAPAPVSEAETADPRLAALARCWGAGRVFPGDKTSDALHPARLGLKATDMLGVIGPGLAAPILALAHTHPGPIQALEWREETRNALTAGLKAASAPSRILSVPFDLETGQLPADGFDGLVVLEAFAYCGNPSRLAVQMARSLKAGAGAVVDTYVGEPGPHAGPAFASAFAEPQLLPRKQLEALLFEAGFKIEADEDETDAHVSLAKEGFKALAAALDGGLSPAGLKEAAWEAETWRARLALLQQGRLERRLYTLRKR
jgi:hypothetical protein